jgi:hypothetical protein
VCCDNGVICARRLLDYPVVDIHPDGHNLLTSDLRRQVSPTRGLLSCKFVPFFTFTRFLNLSPITLRT